MESSNILTLPGTTVEINVIFIVCGISKNATYILEEPFSEDL